MEKKKMEKVKNFTKDKINHISFYQLVKTIDEHAVCLTTNI